MFGWMRFASKSGADLAMAASWAFCPGEIPWRASTAFRSAWKGKTCCNAKDEISTNSSQSRGLSSTCHFCAHFVQFSFLTWCWSHPGRLSKTLGTFAAAIASCWRITNSWGLSMLLLLSCKVMMDCYCCCPTSAIAKWWRITRNWGGDGLIVTLFDIVLVFIVLTSSQSKSAFDGNVFNFPDIRAIGRLWSLSSLLLSPTSSSNHLSW